MQTDGNLVLYDAQQNPLWNSGTPGNPGAFLAVQDDGNVVIYVGTTPIYATNTAGSDPVHGVSTAADPPVVTPTSGVLIPNPGVLGEDDTGRGVTGNSFSGIGVLGQSKTGDAVFGNSTSGRGVVGVSQSKDHAGVSGHNLNPDGSVNLAGLAGFFDGSVIVTGDITCANADCAEDFDILGLPEVHPGTVMVIDQDGALRQSCEAYDKKVAGVISGGGDFTPGIVLGKQPSKSGRMPLALVGKVYCKVDARYSPIAIGDLLTTSPTPGHAMKASNCQRALGAVIGKALRGLDVGQGLIPILVALQ
jgi:hypothetical protein